MEEWETDDIVFENEDELNFKDEQLKVEEKPKPVINTQPTKAKSKEKKPKPVAATSTVPLSKEEVEKFNKKTSAKTTSQTHNGSFWRRSS